MIEDELKRLRVQLDAMDDFIDAVSRVAYIGGQDSTPMWRDDIKSRALRALGALRGELAREQDFADAVQMSLDLVGRHASDI